MKLSIILPARNEATGVVKTLDFIINNVNEIDYEIVVINDFSEDKTYEIVDKKRIENNKIKLFNNNKRGLGGAINIGINKPLKRLII